MKSFFSSLTFKILVSIILVQVVAMSIIAIYYSNRFNKEIDERLTAQIQAPGKLINAGLFNFEALSKKETMIEIVGEELLEAMVVGFDKTIYYSIEKTDIGKNAENLNRINLENFSGKSESIIIRDDYAENNSISSISPIYSAAGKAPFLFVYIKISTNESEKTKDDLLFLFAISSLLVIISTTFITFTLFKSLFLNDIEKLQNTVKTIKIGHNDETALKNLPNKGELGVFASEFKKMVIEVRESRKYLEDEVLKQTKQLQESKKELISKVGELERMNNELEKMNNLMVGRELKMVEMKKKIENMEKK